MTSFGPGVADALRDLRAALRARSLVLPVPGAAEANAERVELADQIGDHLLPRLDRLDAPLLVVVGGSTGAGKSTITNTLVGQTVSRAGVLRPTTRAPVLVCHPDDRRWFDDDRILPGLARTSGDDTGTSGRSLRLVTSETIAVGLAVLDSPDIDSVEEANRELATQLLAAADLWLFVTTAARYADAVPWDFLRRAQQRSTALAVVLNRVPPGAEAEVTTHLAQMLTDAALVGVELFCVTERAELAGGLLDRADIAPIAGWLDGLALDADERARIVRSTLAGALATVPQRVESIAATADAHDRAAAELGGIAERAYAQALSEVSEGLGRGSLLRSEVLDRWQELIGVGELMRGLQVGVGRVRDRLRAALVGRPTAEAEVRGEIESSLETLVLAAADAAALATVEGWRATPEGRSLLADDATALERSSRALREQVGAEIRSWQGTVLDLVREQGQSKRFVARTLSLGANGIGVALMIFVFANTGGLTGGEVAIAGGTATVSQALLTAIFGEQAVRDLANAARADLLARVERLLQVEAARFGDRVEAASLGAEHRAQLGRAAAAVASAR